MSELQKPLRIGILLRNRHDGPGGLEKVLEIVAKAIQKQNVELYFYGLYRPNYEAFTQEFENVSYLKFPKVINNLQTRLPSSLFRVLQKGYVKFKGYKLFDQMAQDQIDALITLDLSKQFLSNYRFLKKFKEETQTPLLSWIHISLTGSAQSVAQQAKLKSHIFDGHLAISQGLADELKKDYNAQNIALIYNPIDKAPTIPRNPKRFIYIGRITKIKRVDSLLTHLQNLKGDWHLDIYGSTGNENEDLQFINQIKKLNISEKVTFHGWQPNAWQLISEAGLLLLNSTREGFGLVIVEAMMRGIPVISTNCPVGPSELIEHDVNGWLYEIEEEDAMVNLLQNILDGNIALPPQEAIQATVQRFETENYIQNLIHSIAHLINNR